MIQLHPERIGFTGGDCSDEFSKLRTRIKKESIDEAIVAVSTLFHSSLIGYHPRIFPKWRKVPTSSERVILLNVPLSDGLRAQCVYFKKSQGRAFWNVLCFTYRADALSTADAASLLNDDADVWYDAVCRLDKGEPDLTLPRMLRPPSWDAQSVYAISFLTAVGQLKNGSYNEDWHRWLPPSVSPSVPLLKLEVPTSVPSVCNPSPKSFRRGVVAGVAVGLIVGMAIGMPVGMNVRLPWLKFPPCTVKTQPIPEPPNPPDSQLPEPPPPPPVMEPHPDESANGTSEDEAPHDESMSSALTSTDDNAEQGTDSNGSIDEAFPAQPVDATNQVSITDENPPVHEQEENEKDSQQQTEK